jgi:hypothetical protein
MLLCGVKAPRRTYLHDPEPAAARWSGTRIWGTRKQSAPDRFPSERCSRFLPFAHYIVGNLEESARLPRCRFDTTRSVHLGLNRGLLSKRTSVMFVAEHGPERRMGKTRYSALRAPYQALSCRSPISRRVLYPRFSSPAMPEPCVPLRWLVRKRLSGREHPASDDLPAIKDFPVPARFVFQDAILNGVGHSGFPSGIGVRQCGGFLATGHSETSPDQRLVGAEFTGTAVTPATKGAGGWNLQAGCTVISG